MMMTPFYTIATATDPCQQHDFFGLVPWYHYLKLKGCDIGTFNILPSSNTPSDVPLVLLAVVDDALRIAGIVAVAFVMVGAFQYVSSQGNPEQTARAQSTIINALIGAAFAVVSVAFVSFVGSKLGS
jgi:Type IV secretion system pilin